ncbi:uncharacterized protein [Centruroides vittatus]|uniref:uncharacterized protein n=1 Tax=Centruroides vittatus TaxID=120091 RepID=UPI00350FA7D9
MHKNIILWNVIVLATVIIITTAKPKYSKYDVVQYEERDFYDDPKVYGHGPWRFERHGYGVNYGIKDPGIAYEKGYGYIKAFGRDFCPYPIDQCAHFNPEIFQYNGDRTEPYFGWRPKGTTASDMYKDPYRKAGIIDGSYLSGP